MVEKTEGPTPLTDWASNSTVDGEHAAVESSTAPKHQGQLLLGASELNHGKFRGEDGGRTGTSYEVSQMRWKCNKVNALCRKLPLG